MEQKQIKKIRIGIVGAVNRSVFSHHQGVVGQIVVVVFFSHFIKVQVFAVFSKQPVQTNGNADGVQQCTGGSHNGVPPPNTVKTFDSIVGHQIIIVLDLLAFEHLKRRRRDAVGGGERWGEG